MKLLYRLVCIKTKLLCKILYKHKVYGQEHICSGRAIIAPNHTSFLDPPLIAVSWPKEVSFLAKKSLFSVPLLGSVISHLNAYPITGTTQDLSSIKMICQLLNEDRQVVIFPTGVRSIDGTLGHVKGGIGMLAMRCHAPIIPVYIHGCYQIWNRFRSFPKFRGKTVCIIGSPINCEEFKHLDKKAAQEAVGNRVKAALEDLKSWYENGAEGSPP